jgi:transglutaminase-like putative cysteine protease
MYYQIRHTTTYRYSDPIRESQMELRMQPRSEGPQRCWSFRLSTLPRAEVSSYPDALGNAVHHFDIPESHTRLIITAEALVEIDAVPEVPDALGPSAWAELDALAEAAEGCEMLLPSTFARPTEALRALAGELALGRQDYDPLTALRRLNAALHGGFAYAPRHTRVDSPIDEAIAARKGVCQDFTHIFIALARELGVPARYVSGYLFHRAEDQDRSADDATHAWAEALLPGLGWVGFDPTNDLIAGARHIRTAVGRDYADVPPSRGVFKGEARTESELKVAVRVAPTDAPPLVEALADVTTLAVSPAFEIRQQQQQQQQ